MVLLSNDASALVDEMSGCGGLATVDMANDDVDVGLFLSLPIYIYTLKKNTTTSKIILRLGTEKRGPWKGECP